ncbi:MAG: hypothetical protein HQ580_12560 [Planctomycetes bacterium]|nr:hypothetical protein [Planctomycetota bacterium]
MEFKKLLAIGLLIWGVKYELDHPDEFYYSASRPVLPDNTNYSDVIVQAFEEAWDKHFNKPKSLTPASNTIDLWRQTVEQSYQVTNPILIEASKWLSIIKHPNVVLILGKRDSGKSALAYRIVEDMRWTADIYAVGLPYSANAYIPEWITVQPEMEDVPPNSIIIVDETHLKYHAGPGVNSQAKELSSLLNLSRQRNQTIIFVSQESSQIDRNIFSALDVVVFKEPSMFQAKFDRPELRDLSIQAENAFQSISGNKKPWSFVFSQDQGCLGLIESPLPSFWSDKLSRAFASTNISKPKVGKNLTSSERQSEAKRLAALGNKPAQIARIMGLSKATIKNYLDDYPYKDKKHVI